MEISGPSEADGGWVFALRRGVVECCDAPVAVYSWTAKTEAALAWAKVNIPNLFYPPAIGETFFLGIVDSRAALLFKLMWM